MKEVSEIEKTLGMENNNMMSETDNSINIQTEDIITALVHITRKSNKALGGMIIITYTNCIYQATISLFLSSSMILNRYQGIDLFLIALTRGLIVVLSVSRLFFITSMGQGLASAMRKCVYSWKKNQIDNPVVDTTKKEKLDSIYQLLKDNSHSPISPVSAFSLSNRTLLGIIATILTYLIVLIRFKTCKNDRLDFLEDIAKQNLTIENDV